MAALSVHPLRMPICLNPIAHVPSLATVRQVSNSYFHPVLHGFWNDYAACMGHNFALAETLATLHAAGITLRCPTSYMLLMPLARMWLP